MGIYGVLGEWIGRAFLQYVYPLRKSIFCTSNKILEHIHLCSVISLTLQLVMFHELKEKEKHKYDHFLKGILHIVLKLFSGLTDENFNHFAAKDRDGRVTPL